MGKYITLLTLILIVSLNINNIASVQGTDPECTWWENITIEEKKEIILKGRALAMSDVFRFVTTLENSPYFKNAKTTYATTKREEESGSEYADFEVIASYEK